MDIRKIISCSLSAVMLISAAACGNPADTPSGVTAASSSAETSAAWLSDRLDGDPGNIIVGTAADAEQYGIDLDGLRDEGYVIRKQDGSAVIFGKTEDGLDRGVRYYANYCAATAAVSYTYGEGHKVKRLTIAGNDISEYSIWLAADADECHRFAASELRRYIGEACGVYPKIVHEETGRMIVLEQITEEDSRYATLGDEGFNIRVDSGDLRITGGALRGCMYGVYEFLESYIGWRFLYDYENFDSYADKSDGMIDYLYESEHIDIPEDTEDTQIPSFSLRDNYNGALTDKTPDYAVKVKGMNSGVYNNAKYNGYSIMKEARHGIVQSGLYHSYFGQPGTTIGDPQPCFTDEDFIDASIEYFINRTNAQISAGRSIADVDVAQIDSAAFCTCDDCMELILLDGGYVGPVLYYTNLMADAIGEEFPGVYVDMLAYWGTSYIPLVTRPRDNVNISYCYYNDIAKNACYSHAAHGDDCAGTARATTVSNKYYAEEFEGWCEIADRVTIWYYPGMWEWCAIPSATFANLREDLAYFNSFDNVYGLFICPGSYDQTEEWLTFYLLNRLLWDADMTEEEYQGYITEYLYIMCGDGYEYVYQHLMSRIETAQSECWTNMAWTDPSERINLGQAADRFELDIDLYDRAASLASTAAQEETVRLMSRTMYFTGLAATHSEWYLNGDDTRRARYTEIFNDFKELALTTDFCLTRATELLTEDMFNIEENLAVNFSFNQAPGGSATWWEQVK